MTLQEALSLRFDQLVPAQIAKTTLISYRIRVCYTS